MSGFGNRRSGGGGLPSSSLTQLDWVIPTWCDIERTYILHAVAGNRFDLKIFRIECISTICGLRTKNVDE